MRHSRFICHGRCGNQRRKKLNLKVARNNVYGTHLLWPWCYFSRVEEVKGEVLKEPYKTAESFENKAEELEGNLVK